MTGGHDELPHDDALAGVQVHLGSVLDQPATGGQAVDLHAGAHLCWEVGGVTHAPRVPSGTAMATGYEVPERRDRLLRRHRRFSRDRTRERAGKYLLAGMLRCSACGRSMHGATRKGIAAPSRPGFPVRARRRGDRYGCPAGSL